MPLRTASGKLTKIGSFERQVPAASLSGGKGEQMAIANKIGLKRGSKTTARGKRVAKHQSR